MIPTQDRDHDQDVQDEFAILWEAVQDPESKFTLGTIMAINEPPAQESFNRFAQVYLDDAWWGDLRAWNDVAIAENLI